MESTTLASTSSVGRPAAAAPLVACPSTSLAVFLRDLAAGIDAGARPLRLDLSNAAAIDYLSLQALMILNRECGRCGVELTLYGVNETNLRRLRVAGALDDLMLELADENVGVDRQATTLEHKS